MYIRAKIELIADKDAGTFSASKGEWMLQYPIPSSILRALASWVRYRVDAIEGPEPMPSYTFPSHGSASMATGMVEQIKAADPTTGDRLERLETEIDILKGVRIRS